MKADLYDAVFWIGGALAVMHAWSACVLGPSEARFDAIGWAVGCASVALLAKWLSEPEE